MTSEQRPLSNTEKGQTYEDATAEMLSQLKEYFGIANIDDGKPGHIKVTGQSGTVFKLDVLAYENDGRRLVFSCKNTQHRPATEAIGGLYLVCEELSAKGFIVTRKDLSDNMHLVAAARKIRVLEFDPSLENAFWKLKETVTETMTNFFFGSTEGVPMIDELKVIVNQIDPNDSEK